MTRAELDLVVHGPRGFDDAFRVDAPLVESVYVLAAERAFRKRAELIVVREERRIADPIGDETRPLWGSKEATVRRAFIVASESEEDASAEGDVVRVLA